MGRDPRRHANINHIACNLLDLGKSIVRPPVFANDIIVVKRPKPDESGYTFHCSPVDVHFASSTDVLDWNAKTVEVAVGANKFSLSLNQLISRNTEALHLDCRATGEVSEMLEHLGLEDGDNAVTFTLTADNHRPEARARIFLWNLNARIVVTDVDGTITRSDLKGLSKRLVGQCSAQPGVAHLFSLIKDNGYNIIYLSGRPKGEAKAIRDYLFVDVVQDKWKLPVGPVIIAPDGFVDCALREILNQQPQFKSPYLKDILKLFTTGRNVSTPFHAGFGNRKSDRISYRSVLIDDRNIFHINSKGIEVKDRGKPIVRFNMFTTLADYVNSHFQKIEGECSTSGEEGSTSTDFPVSRLWPEYPERV